ncbi:MAG: OmpA family protein [Epsilonproteobacteria bacterium]|nr:OmpA family protein [Campylobacterota bacterium]
MLQILGGNEDEEHEAILTVGMSFPLKSKPQRVVLQRVQPLKPVIVKQRVPVYIDRNKCPKKISAPDRDRDGVEDYRDQCPNTPCDFSVDSYGCPIKTTLRINFATGSSRIEYYSMRRVENFANFLIRNRGSVVKIVGHTDSVGSAVSNLALSQRRASAVANKLIELGVSPARISSEGRGENHPIASNQTVEGKRQNRRIEAILSYPNIKR